jgi:hypothetical protein
VTDRPAPKPCKHSWKVWWESGTVAGRQCKQCGNRERMSIAWCNKAHTAENEALIKRLK